MSSREYNKKYYHRNKEKQKQRVVEWRKQNPEKARAIVSRSYYKRRDKILGKEFQRKIILAGYGPSERCECCLKKTKLVWDHDHITGKFRGWICQQCNLALGHARDNKHILELLSLYLDRYKIRETIKVAVAQLESSYADEVTEEQVRRIDDLVREEFERGDWEVVQ